MKRCLRCRCDLEKSVHAHCTICAHVLLRSSDFKIKTLEEAYDKAMDLNKKYNNIEVENQKLRETTELSKVCNWKWSEYNGSNFWKTDCEEEFCLIDGGTQENHYIYCPKCGGNIIDSKQLEE